MALAINVEQVSMVVGEIANGAAIADAADKLNNQGTDARGVLAALGAANTLASQFSSSDVATFHFGSVGAILNVFAVAEGFSNNEFTVEDIAAVSALIASGLARAPHPAAQLAAKYFNALAIAPVVGHWIGQNAPLPSDINDWWTDAQNWVLRRDPLTLDLDGDGIETLPADGAVLFDQNGDGIKQGTGWVAPDDGLLVLDKNGNGLIDNGNELFGDNTVKADGSLALNGFDALADYDSNGDGRIDAGDAEFANLRIWQDSNSDGVSQSGELKTLTAAGVAAINLDSVASTMSVGNDNVANAVGTFECTDGSESELSAAASSLDLAANPFYREFSDTLAVPEDLQHLPDMQGSGAVRDSSTV